MKIKTPDKPEEIAEYFLEYMNAGNIDGIISLYEENAVLVTNKNEIARGINEIKMVYTQLLESHPQFEKGEQRPPIVNADIALTSSRLINGWVTAEVARRQPDGSWRWMVDQPMIAIESN